MASEELFRCAPQRFSQRPLLRFSKPFKILVKAVRKLNLGLNHTLILWLHQNDVNMLDIAEYMIGSSGPLRNSSDCINRVETAAIRPSFK